VHSPALRDAGLTGRSSLLQPWSRSLQEARRWLEQGFSSSFEKCGRSHAVKLASAPGALKAATDRTSSASACRPAVRPSSVAERRSPPSRAAQLWDDGAVAPGGVGEGTWGNLGILPIIHPVPVSRPGGPESVRRADWEEGRRAGGEAAACAIEASRPDMYRRGDREESKHE
jgi:hypothetical protein